MLPFLFPKNRLLKKRQQSAFFNGSAYLDYGNPVKGQVTGAMTLLVWVRYPATPAGNKGLLCKSDTVSGNYRGIQIMKTPVDNQFAFLLSPDGINQNKSFRLTVTDSTQWNLIGMRYNGAGTLRLTKDGVDVTNDTGFVSKPTNNAMTTVYNTPASWFVGMTSLADANGMTGNIRDPQVYSRELSDAELLEIWNGGTPKDESGRTGLILYPRLNGDFADYSSNPATGSLNNVSFQAEYPRQIFETTQGSMHNNRLWTPMTLGAKTSGLAEQKFVTTETNLIIGAYNSATDARYSTVGVWVDGAYHDSLSFGTATGYKEKKFTLAVGSKTILLRNSGRDYTNNQSASIFRVFLSAQNTYRVAEDKNRKRLVVIGDSISQGSTGTIGIRDGWVPLVKSDFIGNVATEGGAAMQLRHIALDTPTISSFVSSLSTLFDSTDSNALIIALGTNDYYFALWNASGFGTAYGALLDAIHTAFPSLVIYAITPTYRTTETANAVGSTLDDYRNQIISVCSGRGYVTAIEAKTWINSGDLADTVHPNNAGHLKIKAQVQSLLGY